jgi:hypothetical protein
VRCVRVRLALRDFLLSRFGFSSLEEMTAIDRRREVCQRRGELCGLLDRSREAIFGSRPSGFVDPLA